MVWYIEIDRVYWLSIKWVQKQKNRSGSFLPQGSHFVRSFYMRYSLWYIKIEHFHKPRMIPEGSMSKMSVFGVVCCNFPQQFTSGRFYTSPYAFMSVYLYVRKLPVTLFKPKTWNSIHIILVDLEKKIILSNLKFLRAFYPKNVEKWPKNQTQPNGPFSPALSFQLGRISWTFFQDTCLKFLIHHR